jgi:glyoxylase-like metal-dependent hydrolase (beta-lactamase superfamily II)
LLVHVLLTEQQDFSHRLLVEEGYNDFTLIDTCYIEELPKLESYLNSISYKMSDIKRIILTHAHADHVQAANEVKKRTYTLSSGVGAKIYSHWIDSAYLAHYPPYHGPPNIRTYKELLEKYDLKIEDVIKKFGKLDVDPITVDEKLKDGDKIRSLTYSRPHSWPYIALFGRTKNSFRC